MQAACITQLSGMQPSVTPDPANQEEWVRHYSEFIQAFYQCAKPLLFIQAGVMLGGMFLVLGVAFLFYWISPQRIRRKLHLEPLDADSAPDLLEELQRLSAQAGLSTIPQFLWNPLEQSSSGQAFGRRGSYAVALTGGLATQFYTDLPAFRAVILHELAHLRNADVDISYFTVAVWRSFVFLTLIPLLVALMVSGFTDRYNQLLGLYILPLVLLVYLTRNGVLRTREVYADLRASTWEVSPGALDGVLASLPVTKRAGWTNAWRIHPDPSERRRLLSNPQPLFAMGFWEALGVGLATAVALPNLVELFNNLFFSRPDLTNSLPALAFAPLAMGVVGLGAYRHSFSRLITGRSQAGAARLAWGLALGIMLGMVISFAEAITQFSNLQADRSPVSPILFLTGLLITALIAVLLLRWIGACASAWLEIANSQNELTRATWAAVALAAGLFTFWLLFLTFITRMDYDYSLFFQLMATTLPLTGPLGLFSFYQQPDLWVYPILLMLFAGVWALPLSAWFFRHRRQKVTTIDWALLPLGAPSQGSTTSQAHSTGGLAEPQLGALKPWRAFWIGVIAAVAYAALITGIRVILRLTIAESVRTSDEFYLTFYIGLVLTAGLITALAGGLAALLIARLSAIHGLFAAFVGSAFSWLFFLIINVIFGGGLEPTFVWNSWVAMQSWGFLFALPVAILAGWVRGVFDGIMGRGSNKQPQNQFWG
jgi:Zn-dependent protease with chaperone function